MICGCSLFHSCFVLYNWFLIIGLHISTSFQMPHQLRLRKLITTAWKLAIQIWVEMIQRPQISACSLMKSMRWVSQIWNESLKFFLCFYYKWSIAVQVLSDPVERMVYDEIHGHALTATNPFFDGSIPRDHAFVDEFSCIGMSKFSFLVIPEFFTSWECIL